MSHPVGGLPGGGKLVALIEQVTAEPGAIRAVATRWTTAASATEDSGSALRTATSGVDGGWQGQAADAFVQYMTGIVGLCGDTSSQLQDAAGVLEQAATLLETTKDSLDNACDAVVAQAGQTRSRMAAQDATETEIQQALATLVTLAYEQLSPRVDEVDAQLGALADQLAGLTGDGFAQYPQPDGGEFVPEPGRPVEWTPSPLDNEPSQTGAQGADGPASQPPPSSTGPGPGPGPGTSSGGGGGGGSDSGGGGLGPSGAPPPGGGPAPKGQVAEWIQQAIEILKAHGYPVDKMNPNDIWMIIQHESGGNPSAINNWDSNAAKGTPSKGLMQTIDPTFNAHALPGHGDVYNPVDNIIAGVRYAIDRYGSVSNVPGVVGVKNGTGYRGY